MKCEHCDHRFSLTGEQLAFLSAPGYLFFAGHALFINAAVLASTAILATGLSPHVRMLVFMLGEVGLASGCVAYSACVVLAAMRYYQTDGRVDCPDCGARQKLEIWMV